MCPRARRRDPAFAEPCYVSGWLELPLDSPLGEGGTVTPISQMRTQRLGELTQRDRHGTPSLACPMAGRGLGFLRGGPSDPLGTVLPLGKPAG